jgi:hypothetical protein
VRTYAVAHTYLLHHPTKRRRLRVFLHCDGSLQASGSALAALSWFHVSVRRTPFPTHTAHAHTHTHTCSVSLPPMGTRETTLVCVLTRPILASLGIYCTRYTVDRISGLREYDSPGDIVSDRFNNRALSLVTVLISSCSVFLYMVSRYSLASSPFVLICHCFRSSSSVKKPC